MRWVLRGLLAVVVMVLVAYVYGGETPPDFEAIAASGFGAVALDNSAPWFSDCMVEKARRHGLIAVAFPMGYEAGRKKVGK